MEKKRRNKTHGITTFGKIKNTRTKWHYMLQNVHTRTSIGSPQEGKMKLRIGDVRK
jgi:hypothetical protein